MDETRCVTMKSNHSKPVSSSIIIGTMNFLKTAPECSTDGFLNKMVRSLCTLSEYGCDISGLVILYNTQKISNFVLYIFSTWFQFSNKLTNKTLPRSSILVQEPK